MKRATETVRIAFGSAVPVIADARLRELNYGDFNGQPSAVVEAMKRDKIKEPFPNGESYEQAVGRVRSFLLELKEKYSDKTVLVVGHRATHYGLEILANGVSIEELLAAPFRWQPYWEYEI